jgi:anti-sigma regulatory factor (Ser/Thr protein kinase)
VALELSRGEVAPEPVAARQDGGCDGDDSHVSYRHEALLYDGDDQFVERVSRFVRAGVESDEPILVVVGAPKIEWLRQALGADHDRVSFADMADVGRNPARIIPAWRAFVDAHPDTVVRGVGEPLDADRHEAERAECHVHESLLNVALTDASLWLMCPYDVGSLPDDDIAVALANHPHVVHQGDARTPGEEQEFACFTARLPEPSAPSSLLAFERPTLPRVRACVDDRARSFGLAGGRRRELVLAVSEIATNSVVHGGGGGCVRTWTDGDRFVVEISDQGRIDEPLVGRVRPGAGQAGGHGVWVANQLTDLVQIRSGPAGTVVRLHMAR